MEKAADVKDWHVYGILYIGYLVVLGFANH